MFNRLGDAEVKRS